MKAITSATVDPDLKDLADKNFIKTSRALEFGYKFLLAEKGLTDFPENSLIKKLAKSMTQLSEISQKYHELLEQTQPKETEENKEDVEKQTQEDVANVLGV